MFSTARGLFYFIGHCFYPDIDGSEMTKSIIFCVVFPNAFRFVFESPNFSRTFWDYLEPFSNFLAYYQRFSPNFCCFHRTFPPNFLRFQGTFQGTVYPVSHFLNRYSSIVTPVQIIECGVERSRFRLILWFFCLVGNWVASLLALAFCVSRNHVSPYSPIV